MHNKVYTRTDCPLFLIMTPARNEEKFLPRVIKSINKSSFKPALWVIVDDNSNDKTPNIIQYALKEHRYIKKIRLSNEGNRNFFNYSYVCKTGFDYTIQLAKENEIDWEYIILLDADTIVEQSYFEDIIVKMQEDSIIGIASGEVYVLKKSKIIIEKRFRDRPSGTARIWRKDCFLETDGYSITQAPDSVSRVKANLKGWRTVRFREPKAYQLRETSSAEGLWKGYVIRGEVTYHLHCHILLVLTRGLSYMIQPKFYLVIPYFIGYLESMIRKKPRIQDEEIVLYYQKERLNELLSNRLNYIRQIIGLNLE